MLELSKNQFYNMCLLRVVPVFLTVKSKFEGRMIFRTDGNFWAGEGAAKLIYPNFDDLNLLCKIFKL
jgi:hypothetical protein